MKNVYVALENVRSLYNIGALFRTCSFFGFYNVLLVGYSGKTQDTKGTSLLHPKIHKSALGSENDLNITLISHEEDLINFCKNNSLDLICVEQHSSSILIKDFSLLDNYVLVFGNEVTGVSETLLAASSNIIEIEKLGDHNSLNITTSCGIVLYELTR
jgi:tRNA G18 (ribose-2'-O)-methylase SpoU